ncbi:MAG: hypothetical protein A3A33_02595 [Candidatus Yanofskybacteria bacterium RIFCSPLOWO2_01_FULL_49_25]|uniref:PDZ domain-containing protein n=1 Tax=Candidatus Yanofskybacteria bacterium RIFCSPLOWO2_01_FULL_49_25 TaxID=1802701 RepID=A0A1F8GWU5_9BACT|nr:MAG: hypothetical protein A3A33_02595 [Candidatus Yanofskybacteria bacterium RIFCSPLOWO2_01_FULL_49_25]
MDEHSMSRFAVVAIVAGLIGGWLGSNINSAGFRTFPASINDAVPGISAVSSEEQQVIQVVKRASPSVVSIVATQDLKIVEQGQSNPFRDFCNDPFFRQFFGDQCSVPSQPPTSRTEQRQIGAGSGFIISSDGMILTNKHVITVGKDTSFTVITHDGKKYPAKILAQDPVQDLAVMKIDARNLPSLTLGDSTNLQIGQTVIAIGNALGQFSNSVSKGVISGLSRSIVASDGGGSSEKLSQVIQTDAAINPGNSGGPLLNLSGEVIGVNTAIAEGAQNIGFAIPINQAKRDIDQVKSGKAISYPFLGVRYILIDDEIKAKNNLAIDNGALVSRGDARTDLAVTPGSPADKAGIRENDIILEVDGITIDAGHDLSQIVQTKNVGQIIKLKILSQGTEKTVSVTLAQRK